MGGTAACAYTRESGDIIDGVVMWASYPSAGYRVDDKIIKAVSIYGNKDGLVTADEIETSRLHLPPYTQWVEIAGGNHTQFGWYDTSPYPVQIDDNPADITREAQQAIIIDATLDFLNHFTLCSNDPENDYDNDYICGDIDSCPFDPDNDIDEDTLCGDVDNCPELGNPDQRDVDVDGRGNPCDNCELVPNADQRDLDGDGLGDGCDKCPATSDPNQGDADGDGAGDLCDNCVSTRNESQHDYDSDATGDECDTDDGVVLFRRIQHPLVRWQTDSAYTGFNLYRGSLLVLLDGGPYTQEPGSNPYAGRFCGLPVTSQEDSVLPVPGEALYWLVAGVNASGEEPLGHGTNVDRPNDSACP
jgi:hypothetical protein